MPTKKLAAPDWREDVDKWLDTLKAGARSSETIKTRKRQLVTLSNAIGVSPGEVTGEQLVSWFASRDWKPETRKGYRNAVHSFFSWMLATGRRDDDPSDALPSVKRPQPHPRPCPDRIIMRALAKADESEIVMLRLGAECGLRRHEICRVHSDDVMHDLIGYSLIVRGKGDKQRLVPLPDDLAETITKANGYMSPDVSPLIARSLMSANTWQRCWETVGQPIAFVTGTPRQPMRPPTIFTWCRNCWGMRPSRQRNDM